MTPPSQQLNRTGQAQGPNRPSHCKRASSRQRIVAGAICLSIVVFFIAFALAGRYHFDIGQLTGHCGFKQTFGLPCPTCGMTTATVAFAQGKIVEAFYTQPACALLCCVVVAVALVALIVALSGVYFPFIDQFFKQIKLKYMILALIVIVIAGWAVTLAQALAERR